MIQLRDVIKYIKSERELLKSRREDYSIQALRVILHKDLAKIRMHPYACQSELALQGSERGKCKVLGSHQVPLWIVFENADPNAGSIQVRPGSSCSSCDCSICFLMPLPASRLTPTRLAIACIAFPSADPSNCEASSRRVIEIRLPRAFPCKAPQVYMYVQSVS